MRNKHANTCQHLQPGQAQREMLGGWVGGGVGGALTLEAEETSGFTSCSLEFTFEFH